MQILKPVLFFCLIIFCSATLTTDSSEKIQWLKMDDISVKLQSQNKPILFDVYTDWCYWCKVMDKKTYANSKVIAYINEHFYSAKINAEAREIINWQNKTYKYDNGYQINDFALFLTNGRASFPTTVIIPDLHAAPISIAGYLEPRELEGILKYFGEGDYKTKNYPEFQKTFKPSW